MKRFLSVLMILMLMASCMPALAEGATIKADWMPYEVTQFFSTSQFTGWEIGESASYLLENTVGGTFFFAVAQKEGHNVLYGFKFDPTSGKFNFWLKSDNCLPQGDGFFRVRFTSGGLYLLFDMNPLNLGDTLEILFTRADFEESGDTELFFPVNKNGQFLLKLLSYDHLWSQALFTDDSVTYYFEGERLGTAYGTLQRDLRYFSLSAFPRTLIEAREKLTQAPSIPTGELTAQKIKFTGGQKFPVYSGPGMEYERAANGKASVSTNDWIQVFGSENSYILIQYAISSSQMRMGYIDASSLPKNTTVAPLRLEYADAAITANTFLTDDPLNSQTRVRGLSAGENVKWLSTMGDWVYVEIPGTWPIRGFVPANAVSKARRAETVSASFQAADYTARAAGDITFGTPSVLTVTVNGPAAWNQAGADAITSYQVYANNVPLAADSDMQPLNVSGGWNAVFSLSAIIPAGTTVIGLCPVHANAGTNAGETIMLLLGDFQGHGGEV